MALDQERQNLEKQGKVIKSGIEFLAIIGVAIIIIGTLGSIGIVSSFDWETYNDVQENEGMYSSTFDGDEENIMVKPDIFSMWIKAGSVLVASVALGSFFIALDKIAFTLKKIQLGIKD